MPWNARDGVGRLGPRIPKSDFWASAKEGIDQVGCVYTAQGFEFDYVVEETSFLAEIGIASEGIGRVTGRWART